MSTQTLGHYAVVEKIGAGGMGEVYRAHDGRLGRDVAIKVLPEVFARDPDRLARFQREAHLLAALNHPCIAAIYGLEEAAGKPFLVLELVSGQTLADRLATGPVSLQEALEIAAQVAEGLDIAHERGIIHRDLKPANIKLTPDGKVKILDFGLAAVLDDEPRAVDPSHSPTTLSLTREGIVLGTASYMSPEQARGKATSKRTDIWSFGCLLYEMLTGRKAFNGETVSDALAAVLTATPDWSALPSNTPPAVRLLIQRCLQKDPSRRLRDMGDARLEIEAVLTGGLELASPPPAPVRLHSWKSTIALLAVCAGLVATLIWWNPRLRTHPVLSVTRFAVPVPAGDWLSPDEYPVVTISPDGSRIAFVVQHGGISQLYLRDMDSLDAKLVPGGEGAAAPFFSPDGQWLGFFAGGALKKVAISGGLPLTLCEAPIARGASWGADGKIIFATTMGSGLSRVSESGGAPEILTRLDSSARERTHRWPEILPGGEAVLFTIGSNDSPEYFFDARIAVQSLKSKNERKVVLEGGTQARYFAGHLVYASAGGLFAIPFDLAKLQVTGRPVRVLDDVATDVSTGASQFALTSNGLLVYLPEKTRPVEHKLVWVNRRGNMQELPAPPHNYAAARLSPDGRFIATIIAGTGDSDVWVYDVKRGTLSRLTTEPGNKMGTVWTRDGKGIAYGAAMRGRGTNLFWKAADGSGPSKALLTGSESPMMIPGSFSSDGKLLMFDRMGPAGGFDVWVLSLEGEHKPRPFLDSPFLEQWGVFSPDGRWVAYQSEESGHSEVYVRPFPGPGRRVQISTEGGFEPAWSRNGRELFYRTGDKMMVVPLNTEPHFAAGAPKELFEGHYSFADYDVGADGGRFLMIKGEGESRATELNIIMNWQEEWKTH